jgi:hypothetical protein
LAAGNAWVKVPPGYNAPLPAAKSARQSN